MTRIGGFSISGWGLAPFWARCCNVCPIAFGVGVDISAKACAIARSNLEAQGLAQRGRIVCGDWTSPLRGRFDLIVSNPPYIPDGEISGLAPEVRVYDPHLALDGGVDGLTAYRAIIPALASLLGARRPDRLRIRGRPGSGGGDALARRVPFGAQLQT